VHAAEQERPDVAAARAQWRQQQPKLAPAKLIFLDETSCGERPVILPSRPTLLSRATLAGALIADTWHKFLQHARPLARRHCDDDQTSVAR
jgi:hypothetical protein